MQNRRIPVIVLIVLVVLIGGYYGVRALTGGSKGALKASGTIEATTVNVSPELAGKVQQVLVEEGQSVKTGQPLFQLDSTLLKTQRDAAAAGLQVTQTAALTSQAAYASAQAQYTMAENSARSQARPTRLSDWAGKTPDYFNQPKWYFTQDEQIAASQAEVTAAQAALTARENNLAAVVGDLHNAEFVAAEKRLSNARLSYLVALQVQAEGQAVGQGKAPDELDLQRLNITIPPAAPGYRVRIHVSQNMPNQELLYDASQTAYDAASSELSAAQVAYNKLLTSASAQAVLKARAALAVAVERVQVAQEKLSALQTGAQSPQVAAAAAVLEQAKSAAQQAQDAVGQAQANLSLLEAQLAKLVVAAPMEGVILT
ncbi:MAG: biotin/lipoyl-binding protein, partial [Anaerolineales bacterium]